MKRILTGIAVTSLITCGVASAADFQPKAPPAPVYSWTGFYAGVNAGYAWGDADAISSFTCPSRSFPTPVGCALSNDITLASISEIASGNFNASGFIGGIQTGYNLQSGSIVLGIELDFNAFNLTGSRTNTAVAEGPAFRTVSPSASIETDWLFTARGRLGWTVAPTLLLYATGGLALTEIRVANSFPTPPELVAVGQVHEGSSSQKHERIGYVVGGGLEWALNRHWTLKGEYLFLDFRSIETTAEVRSLIAAPNSFTTSVDVNAHIARLGINYKF